MVKITAFMSRPSAYRNRELYNIRKVHLLDIVDYDDGKLFVFNCGGKYHSEILIQKGGYCKFYCQCPSFKYQFSSMLFRRGALLHPEYFKRLSHLPRKHALTYFCKHLEACLKKFKTKILREAH